MKPSIKEEINLSQLVLFMNEWIFPWLVMVIEDKDMVICCPSSSNYKVPISFYFSVLPITLLLKRTTAFYLSQLNIPCQKILFIFAALRRKSRYLTLEAKLWTPLIFRVFELEFWNLGFWFLCTCHHEWKPTWHSPICLFNQKLLSLL